jgi:hypothetical protein
MKGIFKVGFVCAGIPPLILHRSYARVVRNRVFMRILVVTRQCGKKPGFFGQSASALVIIKVTSIEFDLAIKLLFKFLKNYKLFNLPIAAQQVMCKIK